MRLFYEGENGSTQVRTYTAQNVLTALREMTPYDWKGFFYAPLKSLSPRAPLGGLEMSGWKLIYNAQPNSFLNAVRLNGLGATMDSMGISLESDGMISDILRGGPSDAAGLVPGMKVVMVNGQPWSPPTLLAAIADTTQPSIRLQTEFAGISQEFAVAFHDGPRYPHLERLRDRSDLLTTLFTPLPAPAEQTGKKGERRIWRCEGLSQVGRRVRSKLLRRSYGVLR